jgi:hypothetical protein
MGHGESFRALFTNAFFLVVRQFSLCDEGKQSDFFSMARRIQLDESVETARTVSE